MKIPKISICSWKEAQNRLISKPNEYESLISIGGKKTENNQYPTPQGFDEFSGRKIRLEFDDLIFPIPLILNMGYLPPTSEDVAKIINFCQGIQGPTLIHCAAGISRSSAAALILIALKMGAGHEEEAVHHLITLKDKDPDIFPNEMMLAFADEIMDLEYRLVNAFRNVFL